MSDKPLYRAIIILCLIAGILTLIYSNLFHSQPSGQQLQEFPPIKHKLILIPLDSRPPCGQLVADNGRTAGIEIILPPHELMDYYTQPSNMAELKKWLQQEISHADGAIISIDQLLYGGLLASRERLADNVQIQELLEYLTQLHQENPAKPIYAFDILPRMNPPAKIETYRERKNLMEWSRISGRLAFHAYPEGENAASLTERLGLLEAEIPAADLKLYQDVYAQNRHLNQQLALMVKQGTITKLVLGQDDGEQYSLPNMELQQLEDFFQQQQLSPDQVFMTHGADEIALSILAQIYLQQCNYQPKIFLSFNSSGTAQQIMPYMAVSLQQAAEEKLILTKSQQVFTPEAADIILYLSCGNTDTMNQRETAVQEIKTFLQQGKQVALVDLSQHFTAQETLFPLMLKQQLPLNQLCAYAGWNTASNSIGTAMAQAQIYLAALQQSDNKSSEEPQADISQAICYSNLLNLSNRFGEDYYYLKDVIDLVNGQLKQKGYTNVYDLDLEHNYRWSVAMLRSAMKARLHGLSQNPAYQQPFTLQLPTGPVTYQVRQLTSEVYFPWPRTFEIALQNKLVLCQIK